ncbi:FtsX-like permease family protein [Aliikangiella marina]|uniref:FtsX-like permease family protein n=1 Tax=Aliikangiella marina TaxID=1712262 RepID=A0A545TEF2_9GAMM|nr:FtsX-like permease family protein [Aliikangiella marina]TQV75598.1 FtsX-like permease family protein [Aliikangiella marina]
MRDRTPILGIASKIFRRDWKRGDMLVLLFAMCISMASVSVIYLIIDRIESATEKEVADVLGADLVIRSPAEVAPAWLERAKELNLQQATSVEFSSVLFANDKLQLSTIKAVSEGFPLKGRLEIADSPYENQTIAQGIPAPGEVWVEPRIFSVLNIEKGNPVEVGYTDLQVGGALMLQPGQGSTLFNIAPTAIMNVADLEATKIIQPGSRVNFRYLFAGSDESLKIFAAEIKEQLSSSQRLVTIFDESPVAGSAISRSKKYIGLSSLLTMILLGVTIAMSASRYARRQFDNSALMRCFGLTNNQVLKIFTSILSMVCLVGIALGSAIGIAFQELLVHLFAEQFIKDLPAADYSVLLLPMLATVVLLFGFSIPSLIQLKSVPPMRVLRRQLIPMGLQSWSVYLLAGATLVFVMWLQMGDMKLLGGVLSGLVLVALVFTVLAHFILKFMKRMARSQSAAVNFSLRQLDANKGITLLHLLAFSITIFVIALIVLVRSELLSKWQESLGEDVPNHFMVNVKPAEVEELRQLFDKNQIEFAGLYPMIRGRIVGINGEDVKTAVSETGQQHNSLRRELNLTWANELPLGNKIVDGEWDWQADDELFQISLEDKTADALGLKLGDTLNFLIGSEKWDVKITSIRSIDWQTFTPNFYVIAKPGAMDSFKATYISSFFMEQDKKPLLAEIVKNYPSITIIEIDLILAEIQSIISKVSSAVELIMVFVVAAGLGLLWAAMEHTFDAKYRQSAILRTLGASKAFIARSFRFEYLWLALLSSSMAIMAVELVSFILYTQVFDIEYQFHWQFWWSLPLGALVLMLSASWRGVKRVTEPPPLSLIRQS